MSNIIKLKTGKQIKLAWSFLVLEYLEEREGSLESLQLKIKHADKNKSGFSQIRLINSFIYSIIQANYDDEVLTYKQTIRLVDHKDYKQIFNFIVENLESENEFKKKQSNPNSNSGSRNHNRKKPKK